MSAEAKLYEYQSEVVRTDDGVGFGRRDVPQSCLEPAREQTIFAAQRRGLLKADADGGCLVEIPVFGPEGDARIQGVRMAAGEGPGRVELDFELNLFEPFATAMIAELLKAKQLAPKDHVGYRVFARNMGPPPCDGASDRVVRTPLPLTAGRLDDWFAVSQAEGPVGSHDYPLFILEEEVLEQARRLCWRGKTEEGGCWLLGNLFQHEGPEPEIFGVIHTAIEAHGMKHDRFGLRLSSETYVRLRQQMELRAGRLGRVGERELGFCHSHPFLPSELYGHDACSECEIRQECSLSSAFLSTVDAQFHAAVFGRAPYAVQMVLGLTPRGEFDLGIFCLDGGRFRKRGFYRVARPPAGAPDFFK